MGDRDAYTEGVKDVIVVFLMALMVSGFFALGGYLLAFGWNYFIAPMGAPTMLWWHGLAIYVALKLLFGGR